MTIFESLILGLVEGFTEFLPISSTAHLILTSHVLGLDQTHFLKTFEIAIQSGAIIAVLVVYWRRFLDWEILKKIAAAFIPTAVIGLVLYKFSKQYLLGNLSVVLWALAIGGVLLIAFEKWYKKSQTAVRTGIDTQSSKPISPATEIRSMSYKKAAGLGVAQAIAIIPGVSRSGATIIGGLLAGMSRGAIVEFSFLLGAPTILAATALDLFKNAGSFTSDQVGSLLVGLVAAFITALLGIKFLLRYVQTKTFVGFGVYRILIALIFLSFLM